MPPNGSSSTFYPAMTSHVPHGWPRDRWMVWYPAYHAHEEGVWHWIRFYPSTCIAFARGMGLVFFTGGWETQGLHPLRSSG